MDSFALKFLSGFAKYLREERQDALEASLAWSDVEKWLSFEAGAWINANRESLGIPNTRRQGGGPKLPSWWVSREVGTVDLWIERQYDDKGGEIKDGTGEVYAFELKVCSNYNTKWRYALDDIWWQIAPDVAPSSYSGGKNKKIYGLILAYHLNFADGFGPEVKTGRGRSHWTQRETKENYWNYIAGKQEDGSDRYAEGEFWRNLQPEGVENQLGIQVSDYKNGGQYLDPNEASEVRLFLIKGKSFAQS